MTLPVGSAGAAPRGRATADVEDGHLSAVASLVAPEHHVQRLLWRHPGGQQLHPKSAVHRVGDAWCAMAATPPLIEIARLPVANAFDWTAAPSSPVAGSLATIENVPSVASCAGSRLKATNVAIAMDILIMRCSWQVETCLTSCFLTIAA